MREICLVCNCGVLSRLQQPKSVNVMMQYVLGFQKKQDQIICDSCYNDLKHSFSFKRKFHQSRRLRLKNLKSNRAIAESEHNYFVQGQGELPAPSHLLRIDAKDQLTILANVDKNKGVKYVLQNQSDPLVAGVTATNERGNDEAISTYEQNEPTCSKYLLRTQTEDQNKEDPLKVRPDLANVEHFENEGTEEVFYIVELLGPVENGTLENPLDQGTDRENNQVAEMVQNQKVQSKDGAGIKPQDKVTDSGRLYDITSKLEKTQCVFCFLIFSTFEELVDHKKYHQEEQSPYRCPNFGCKARFKYWHSRQRHLVVHTESKLNVYARARPERTRWVCSYCGRGFALKEVFDSHLKSHNREQHFECKYCFKSFATETNLNIHLRIHTKGSPFECHDCGRGFISYTRLDIHKRMHSGFKPFRCEVCQAGFICSSGLIKHWRVNSHFRGAIKPPPDVDPNSK